LENLGIWRIQELGDFRNLEKKRIWRIKARLWNLKKARPDPKREFSALSGPVFRNTWQEVSF
jgi:hypothetical protein